MKPTYFPTADHFRSWLAQNHDHFTELFVGFHKKDAGKPSITYHEALDHALCFGWIDGVRKSVSATSYTIRFTPRKPKSYWSQINTTRASELVKLGLMQPPGAKVFAARDESVTQRYSFEREAAKFPAAFVKNSNPTPMPGPSSNPNLRATSASPRFGPSAPNKPPPASAASKP